MRIPQLVDALKAVVLNDLNANSSIITYCLNKNIKGGWEGWLQMVFAQAVFTTLGHDVIFNREVNYPGNPQRCDLYFSGRGVPVWVELKTQRFANYANTVNDFQADIDKIVNLGENFRKYNMAVAFAILQVSAVEKLAIKALRLPRYLPGSLNYYKRQGRGWEDVTQTISDPWSSPALVLLTWRTSAAL